MIKENIVSVKEKISAINPDTSLIVVSKTKPVSMLLEAYNAGCRDFGENKVQELVDKWDQMPKDIRWHMIGHLQRNKVKYIVDKVYLIHSVDSYKLAQEISKEAEKKNTTVNILVEVNVSGEKSKFGVSCEKTLELVQHISTLPFICVKGLMTIAPYVENAEENRQFFLLLHQLSVDIKNKKIDNVSMDILSMGMTGDYLVATEEGATYVRVGTGIFGERNYNIPN